MKLSIIIPVYNVELYLRSCLESIISQDLEDIEILCIDDCSTDASLQILHEYAQKDNRIKVIQHSVNKGLSATRNTGIKIATGEYIQFVDSDDFIEDGACKRLYLYAKENDADIVYFNMVFLNDEENNLIREKQINKEYIGVYTGVDLFCRFQGDQTLKPEAVRHFMKREFLMSNELFFYEGITHEDMLFSFMVAMKAKRVCDLNLALYIYRQRLGSISWGQKEKTASSLLVCLMNICSYWLGNDFSTYESEHISQYIRGMYKYYFHNKCYQIKGRYYGNEKEKMIQKILGDNYFENICFQETDMALLKKSNCNILYGAGKIASEIKAILKTDNIRFDKIVVTDKKGNSKIFDGIDVIGLDELKVNENAVFVIGTDRKYHNEISLILRKKKYLNIIIPIMTNRGD